MGLFGFGKKFAEAKQNIKKMENKDLMEAVVGGCILVAYADGDCSENELKSMEKLIASNDALKHFGAEISVCVNKFHDLMQAGPRVGKMKIMRELDDLKADTQGKEEVFVTMLTIAEADGNIDEKETAILKEVGSKFGLNLKDFGL